MERSESVSVYVCVWGDDAMIALAKVDDNTIYDTPQGH